MIWSVMLTDTARRQLRKIDAVHRRIILTWLAKNIDGCENPRLFGKALTANHQGKWRYRIGEYRTIIEIRDDGLIVLALQVSHRKDVYR